MTTTELVGDRAFFGHPRGLSTLFFTEMWERFSYYGMRAILILFMTAAPLGGGMGFDTNTAGAVYGLYTSMVYLATLPGGWLADRLLGQRSAVLYGGMLIAAGHFSMAVPTLGTFYLGLTLIVIGTGLLKGNISVIVGRLYAPGDNRRDAGFSLYYMGINLGAFFSPLVCGYLGQRVNWHAGFAAAGIGMVFGLVQYVLGSRFLGDAGLGPAPAESAEAGRRIRRRARLWTVLAVAAVVAGAAAIWSGVFPISAIEVADVVGNLLLVVTVAFFVWLFFGASWTPDERRRLLAITVFFLAAALFWSEFEQAGSSLNLFADRATSTTYFGVGFPSSWFQSVNPIFIIVFAPVFAWLWIALGRHEPSSPVKFSLGLLMVGAGFGVMMGAAALAANGTKVSPNWLIVTYLLHTFGELSLSPVGLSAMTKLAPERVSSVMMGVWFLAAAVGNFIAGRLAGFYESMPLPRLFGIIALIGIAAGLVMLALSPAIKRLTGEAREDRPNAP
jgi:proton-dependent oligopeptide transporter, POT family